MAGHDDSFPPVPCAPAVRLAPANVLVDLATDTVRIADLSVAAEHERAPDLNAQPNVLPGVPNEWAYLSPEQTGRMNRGVDYRADFYALGVALYQMLTGRLPFEANDPLEWVHCHIARVPRPPVELEPTLPQPVSDVAMKLLAKVAEDRYQSARGLLFDLELCLTQWETIGRVEPFAIGTQDISDRLQSAQRLYGREAESAALLDAFNRVAESTRTELVVVSGYSGIGKSSLVHELHKPIIATRGNYITGKFDQHKRDIPYATLTEAFRELVKRILSESEARIAMWRQKLQEALGVNGQLIVDVMPAVELVIGKQPPVPELAPNQAQNRFRLVFRRFIGVFARKEHPLVLFLDDLQWADSASLALLKELVVDPRTRYLLIVGAYRDNEVSAAHPLVLTLEQARKSAARISTVEVGPLASVHLNALIADTLRCRREDATPLTQLVHDKTAGNPFFVIQFLTELHHERLIEFDGGRGVWRWDINRIRAKNYTDNVVDLMVGRLKRLPVRTQQALKKVACLGISAEVQLLALVHRRSVERTHNDLLQAVQAGLVMRLDGKYRFMHDRMQEAAYSLIPEKRRAALHLRIGRLLLSHLAPAANEERIFDVVNPLNQAVCLITDADERATLRRLNIVAGKKAKAGIAYASAQKYLEQAAALLPLAAWEVAYEETFALFLDLSECEYLIGAFERAEALFKLMLERARSNRDRAQVYRLQMQACQVAGRFDDAVKAALDALQLFGVAFPQTEADIAAAIESEVRDVALNLGERKVAALVDAPIASDPDVRTIVSLLVEAVSPAHIARPRYFPLLIAKAVNFSLRFGNTAECCFAYSCYANMRAAAGDVATAFEFSEMSLRLNERFNDRTPTGRLLHIHGSFVNLWWKHIATSVPILERGFLACLEVGDLVYAGYIAFHEAGRLFHLRAVRRGARSRTARCWRLARHPRELLRGGPSLLLRAHAGCPV